MRQTVKALLTGALLAAAAVTPSAAKDSAASGYLKGDMRALDMLALPVNLADSKIVSGYDGNKRLVEKLATKKGKALLITFWTGDCLPCRGYLRQLDALQEVLGGDHFEVVAINQSRDTFARTKLHLKRWGIKRLKPYGSFNHSLLRELRVNPAFTYVTRGPLNVLLDGDSNVIAYSTYRHNWTAPEAVAFATAMKDGKL